MKLRFISLLALAATLSSCCAKEECKTTGYDSSSKQWTIEQANQWGAKQEWLIGCNYIPANAINQLEMWQAEYFDAETIEKELQLAGSIGFNTLRVYLHSLVWKADSEGFKSRIDKFLTIAQNNGIKPILVFFDDCWNPYPKLGAQPKETPYTHNSGWVQDPGAEAHDNWDTVMPELKKYVIDVLTTFKDDNRILMWDLYNEPGNQGPTGRGLPRLPDYENKSLPLVNAVFEWGWEVRPSQPMSMGVWKLDLVDLNVAQMTKSDIITYHNYNDLADHTRMVKYMQMWGRPIICTEFMSRGSNSTFEDILPMLKANNIGAVNWGFIDGKTQTIFPWDSWDKDYNGEPELWFHDIFRKDHTPYRQKEVDLIKKLTGKQ